VITGTTEAYDERLSKAWADVQALVVRQLLALGAQPADAEDATQEALIRAWSRHVPFRDPSDLARWCKVVARHCWIDELRATSRRRTVPLDAAEGLTSSDTQAAVEHRDLLDRVVGSLSSLSETQRAALLAPGAGQDRREQVRLGVARHRARRRLLELVGEGSVLGVLLAWTRRALRAGAVSVPSVAAAAALTALLMPMQPGPGPAPVQAPAPPHTTAEHRQQLPEVARSMPARRQPSRSFPAARQTSPHGTLRVAGPASVTPRVSRRERRAEDHLVCLDDAVLGHICADLPTT
jgi:hypothetical protein